jgi:hypothetical protein
MQAAAIGDLDTLQHKQLVILYKNDIEINCSIGTGTPTYITTHRNKNVNGR